MRISFNVLLGVAVGSAVTVSNSIVDLAVATPDLSTLVTALKAADLVGTLSGIGPFTVFAPTNEAFAALPAGVLANLLKPENKAQLVDILTYHVASGDVHAKDLKDMEMVKTVEGKNVQARVSSAGILINSAKVTSADNDASNGVVHIIDSVLMPNAGPTTNHLWFNIINQLYPGAQPQGGRCGEVDAAPRMPPSLFEPQNAAELQRYIKVTTKLYGAAAGRCADVNKHEKYGAGNFTQFDGIVKASWFPTSEFTPLCREICGCTPDGVWQPGSKVCKETPLYCACQDVADDPSESKFCSLCGPKFNDPIDISLYVRPGTQSIVGLAVNSPDLSTLVTALKAADLVGTLSGKGPFTVFAPTNEAFAALPAGVLANLLKPENKAQLVDILTYHVASGDVQSKDLTDMEMIPTVEGKSVTARVLKSGILINSARVITPDNEATNGVVHIIDAVLMPPPKPPPPPPDKTIVQLAAATKDLSTLVTALKAAGLVALLSGKGPHTVFAPTNEAFAALPAGVLANLLKPENKAKLVDLLSYHVANGDVQSKDLTDMEMIKTVEGQDLKARVSSSAIFINSAKVTAADNEASNGVVHIIDAVLQEPSTAPTGSPKKLLVESSTTQAA